VFVSDDIDFANGKHVEKFETYLVLMTARWRAAQPA
jgi:hypothetical protein